MTEKDVILNAQTPSGAAPGERIDIALRKAIADLHCRPANGGIFQNDEPSNVR